MPELRILPERPYRELPGLVGRLNRLNRWAQRADVRPLREDELIIYESGTAFVLAGFESLSRWQRWTQKIFVPAGWLRLTDQRLIWMPDSPRYFPPSALPVIELELADIVAVVRGRGGWPRRRWYLPLFRIDLRNGKTYLFQAPFGGTLRKAIAKAAGLPEPS